MSQSAYDICPDCGDRKDKRAKRCKACHFQQWRASFESRFWDKVKRDNTENCWQWLGFCTPQGYGMIGQRSAHRIAYELTFGPIPEGTWVCHHCDNPGCCNPYHLFLGTAQDNAVDMVSKGRGVDNRGSRNGSAKLNQVDVLHIREEARLGTVTRKELAVRYGLTLSGIGAVICKHTWAWLKG